MLEGLLVPMFTGFRSDESVAYDETVALAKWLVDAGVDGLVPFGTFGEGASLSLAEKIRLTEEILKVSGTAKVVPSLICNSFGEIAEYLEFANSTKVDGVMVMPPGYFRPGDDGALRKFFERVSTLTTKPVIAYNFPAMSLTINPKVLVGLNLWGVKDSSGSIDSAKAYLDSNIKLLIGSDVLLAEAISLGASGGICGIGNFFPRRMKRINDLARGGKLDEARREVAPVAEFSSGIVQDGFTPGLAISAIKSAAPKFIPISLGDMRTPVPKIVTEFSRWSKSLEYSEISL
ncbi:MAG: dihydrodipicolinate synthase family protein [Actinobacteria bacterium]|nr:dihydrodipicolinate synthase family protein [Actinomycetota bacterium]